MKIKISIGLLFLLVSLSVNAQLKELPYVKSVINNASSVDRSLWDLHALAISIGSKDAKAIRSSNVPSYLDSLLKVNEQSKKADITIIKKYQNEIKQVYNNLSKDWYYSPASFPVKIGVYNDTNIIIIFTGLFSKFVYLENNKSNSLELLVSEVLPVMKVCAKSLDSANIGSIGIVLSYGIKNDNSPLRANSIILLSPKNLCVKYVNGQIRAAELLVNSEIYISDNTGLNRIQF